MGEPIIERGVEKQQTEIVIIVGEGVEMVKEQVE